MNGNVSNWLFGGLAYMEMDHHHHYSLNTSPIMQSFFLSFIPYLQSLNSRTSKSKSSQGRPISPIQLFAFTKNHKEIQAMDDGLSAQHPTKN